MINQTYQQGVIQVFNFTRNSAGQLPTSTKVAGGAATAAVAVAAVMAILVPFTGGWEGFATHPYIDWVGTGHPETWCYGETGADTHGKVPPLSATFTKAECTAELQDKLTTIYYPAIMKCVKVPMGVNRTAALVDAAYNLGPSAVCNGAIVRNINAGNPAAGCQALKAYVYASGRVVQGLINRRAAEYKLCMEND